MTMTRDKLPKAKLIDFAWSSFRLPGAPLFFKNRLANAYRFQLWRVIVHIRMPWLDHSARALYPHLFRDSQ
jgi:hypothetical protein